jgi:hypothetical protein
MKNIFKDETFNEFANLLINNGFDILIPEKPDTWNYLTFTKYNKIGYCQLSRYKSGVSFSTVHKPCREVGTGYGLDESSTGVEPTIENALKAFVFAPNWAKGNDLKAVVKYKDFQEYLDNSYTSKDRTIIKAIQ